MILSCLQLLHVDPQCEIPLSRSCQRTKLGADRLLSRLAQLVGITQTQQVVGINGGLQIFNWICSLYGTYLVPRVPRRKLLMSAWVGVLFSNGSPSFPRLAASSDRSQASSLCVQSGSS